MSSPRGSPEKTVYLSASRRQNEESQSPRRSMMSSSSSSSSSSAIPLKRMMSDSPPPVSSSPPSGQAPSPSSFKGKPTLAQEIYDEFLVCKICLDAFKSPKSLECLHTFCEHCIESHIQSESTYKKYSDYREFTCPLCRKRTQLPIGGVKKLPDNFLVSSLSEMIGRRRLTKFPFCDICKLVDQKFRDGTAKCLDCAKMLCSSCVAEHQEVKVTSGHSIFDIEIEKNIGCSEHPDEMVRFYCVPCEVCICVLCTFKEHRHHKVTQFSEAVTSYKSSMETTVDQCLEKMDKFCNHIRSLSKCEDILVTVRQKIRDTATSFVTEIERREQQLLVELDNMYGRDCLDFIERKRDLANHVDNFRSTCKLARTILGGKDIELLLLRKDVQEKLESLSAVELKQLPATMNKVVEFVTGEVEFGYLLDHDRPLLTTMILKKKETPEKSPETAKKSPTPKKTSTSKDVVQSSSRSETSSDDSESSDSDDSSDSSDVASGSGGAYRRDVVKDRRLATVERSTMTDIVRLVDKAVNTKARSLLNSTGNGGGKRTSSEQNGEEQNGQSAVDRKNKKREKSGSDQPTITEIELVQQQ